MPYRLDYYKSKESKKDPYALTPNPDKWATSEGPNDGYFATLEEAKTVAEIWTTTGNSETYKSTRIVEIDDDGEPTSVVWMSVWEAPEGHVSKGGGGKVSGGGANRDGYTVHLHVWMHRDWGPPDHWDWTTLLNFPKVGLDNPNAWDFEYGREVDAVGKKKLWSIRLNIWPTDGDPTKWTWWKIFKKTEEEQHEVEVVRIHQIGPRVFPNGVETVECYHCGKTHEKAESWLGWVDEKDNMMPFDRCFCIDQSEGEEQYRRAPDGMEQEGCEIHAERTATAA